MKHKQIQFPFQSPELWEETDQQTKDQALKIIAKMLIQNISQQTETEDHHENTKRSENHRYASEKKSRYLHQAINPKTGEIQ